MSRNELGEIRRSAVVANFGPGALVDFRAGEAAISAVVAGLEEWDRNFPPAGMLHPQAITEERLQKKLHVKGFRLPPVRDPALRNDRDRSLVAVRFPEWLQCPRCDLIGPEGEWEDEPGRAGRWCATCTRNAPGRKRSYVVPVRFITACEHGHLDDFPWHVWVQHKEGCRRRRGFLRLRSEGAGLAGLVVSCPECAERRSLDGIFSTRNSAISGSARSMFPPCRGRRPWLADGTEECGRPVRAMQRGASNIYFPVVESALSIPPWSDRLQEALGVHWVPIVSTVPEDRATYIRILARGDLAPVLEELAMSPEQLAEEVERRLGAYEEIETSELRREEFRKFMGGPTVGELDREFEIRPCLVPDELRPWASHLVRAVRLREVRAVTGFTRIQPPGDPESPKIARLSKSRLEWLPAIEVRGEGIFIALDEGRLRGWERLPAVTERSATVQTHWLAAWRERYGADSCPPRPVSGRLLLLHTLAHALMRQLTLECGYSSTALRERLYVSADEAPMAGILIYTATSDDDGTLGGLQRQSEPQRMIRTFQAAIAAQVWCSSDPLCIEDTLATDEGLSLAACHSCVLAPETGCEEFNRFLDRAMLVGTPGNPEIGFFRDLVRGDVA